jgi:hypothetical protein
MLEVRADCAVGTNPAFRRRTSWPSGSLPQPPAVARPCGSTAPQPPPLPKLQEGVRSCRGLLGLSFERLQHEVPNLSGDRAVLTCRGLLERSSQALLKSTLRAVVAQRLVRMLCDRCKVPRKLMAADIEKDPRFAVIGFQAGEVIHEAGGCERCGGTGYRGRNRVFEILEMSDKVRKLIGTADGLAYHRRRPDDDRSGRSMRR